MKSVASILGVSLALGACGSSSASHDVPDNVDEVRSDKTRLVATTAPLEDVASIVSGNSAFGQNLYRVADKGSDNFIYSPASLSIALAMTYAGARGETATQIADALEFALPDERLHHAFNALDQALESRGEGATDVSGNPFQLNIVNQIWGQTGAHFETAFLDTLAENYGAGLFALDFLTAPEPSRITINDWVADQTNDKILDLLPEGSISSDTRLVLTNAVYFNASWDVPFEVSATADAGFTKLDGATVTVPFMNQTIAARYASEDGISIVELPYDGEEVSMLIAMTNDADDFSALEAGTAGDVFALADRATEHLVDLSMPKFEARSAFSVADALKELGMPIAFDAQADFSGINGAHDLAISDVVHQAFIRVDERGTEAAAATAVIVGETSAPEPATLDVNKPFLFFVRDNATGTAIFAGRVVDPS